jgi:lysine-N-methylase
MPDMPWQRYSCHGCGACCRDFTVQLTAQDEQRLAAQGWRERLGGDYAVEFRGARWLRQTPEGACVFLGENGLCRVHAEFGLEAKPLACQFFPFMLSPGPRRAVIGVSFACGSVAASRGAALESHGAQVRALSEQLPPSAPIPVRLKGRVVATEEEERSVQMALDAWLSRRGVSPATRWEGLAWIVTAMLRARLDRTRGEGLRRLMTTLAGAVERELPLLEWPPPPPRAWKLLRQAVFARLEDPKIGELKASGRVAAITSQWSRSRRWAAGRGQSPATAAMPSVDFARFDDTDGVLAGADAAAMDDLLQRWMRSSVLGGRAWGSGLYGLPIDQGLGLVTVNVLSALWLARFHAAARGERAATLQDLQHAVGRVDRASGRAAWLATAGERLRVSWFAHADALRLLARALAANS